MNEKDFEQLLRDAAAGAAQKEEEAAEAKEKNTTVPKELDDKIEKALKATTPRKNHRWLRRAAVIVTAFAALNLIAYVSVEAYRLGINQVFGSMSRYQDGDQESIVWHDSDTHIAESQESDEALLQYYKDNFPFTLEAPAGMNRITGVSINPDGLGVSWELNDAEEPDPEDLSSANFNYASFSIHTYEDVWLSAYKPLSLGYEPPNMPNCRVEELNILGHTAYYIAGEEKAGPAYLQGSYEPSDFDLDGQYMEIVWLDGDLVYSFSMRLRPDDLRFDTLQKAWKNAILAMEPKETEKKTYLKEPQVDSPPDDKLRQILIERQQPAYGILKNLNWATDPYNINANGTTYIDAITASKANKGYEEYIFWEPTYWDISLKDVKENPEKYTGENLAFPNCKLLGEEKVEPGSDLSNAIAMGRKCYIIFFTDEEGTEGRLYLLSDTEIDSEPGYNTNYHDTKEILGYLLGFDEEGRVILGK